MSKNHLAVFGDFEYFHDEGIVYRANIHNPLSIYGYRQGARFECPMRMWDERRAMLERFA